MNNSRRGPIRAAGLLLLVWATLAGAGCSGNPEAAATAEAVAEQLVSTNTPTSSPTIPPSPTPSPLPPTPTSTPVPPTPVPPTPSHVPPTPSATPHIFVNIADPAGDAFNCQSQELVADSEVDINTVQAWQQNDLLWVRVVLETPLESDYSFAVLLGLQSGDDQSAFIWEIHDKVYRVGEIDIQSGNLLEENRENLGIALGVDLGEVHFSMPVTQSIKSKANSIQIASFHSAAVDSPTNCDTVGPLTFTADVED